MIQFKEEVLERNVVVHCSTEQQAINLLKWADSKGMHWATGKSYLEFIRWLRYGDQTAYSIAGGEYGPVNFYRKKGYKVLSYEEALLKGEIVVKRKEFKVGDRVWDCIYGWGRVYDIMEAEGYPVCVRFGEETGYSYTLDGKLYESEQRTLFFEELPIPETALYTEEGHLPEYTMEELTKKLGFDFKLVKGE